MSPTWPGSTVFSIRAFDFYRASQEETAADAALDAASASGAPASGAAAKAAKAAKAAAKGANAGKGPLPYSKQAALGVLSAVFVGLCFYTAHSK